MTKGFIQLTGENNQPALFQVRTITRVQPDGHLVRIFIEGMSGFAYVREDYYTVIERMQKAEE